MKFKKKPLPRVKHRPKRSPSPLAPLDYPMLKGLVDHELLSTEMVQLLDSRHPRTVAARLQKLSSPPNDYIDCFVITRNQQYLYAPSNRGADTVSTYYGIDRGQTDYRDKNRKIATPTLQHKLGSTKFMVTLILASQNKPDTSISSWIRDRGFKKVITLQTNKQQKITTPIEPDRVIYFQHQDHNFEFFFEYQRTIHKPKFLEKAKGYWAYWRDLKRPKREPFRVLTVTETEAGKETLRALTKQADDRKAGSPLFWFTSEEKYSLKNPESLFQPIWQTPKDDTFHHLLEHKPR